MDTEAEKRALVQRLTLDHASAMVANQKKTDARERDLFAQLDQRDRQLRTREAALRQEGRKRASAEADLRKVIAELEEVTKERVAAVTAIAARNRQFFIEVEEYRRQVASIADRRIREACAAGGLR